MFRFIYSSGWQLGAPFRQFESKVETLLRAEADHTVLRAVHSGTSSAIADLHSWIHVATKDFLISQILSVLNNPARHR